MQQGRDQAETARSYNFEQRNWLSSVLLSPLLWGGLLTFGFYRLIPHLPVQREMAERYFCRHPLEYATTALFFVGIAILGLKSIKLSREKTAIDGDPLEDLDVTGKHNELEKAENILARLESLPAGHHRTSLIGRIRDACLHIRGQHSAERLEDHLKYLAELAAERLHESFALVRTITWAVPILGFLGTVIGITIAIANLRPEQLDTSLAEVTSGLAIAFDTTALALALSMFLVFGAFLVEQSEQRILAAVEKYGIRRISPLFPAISRANEPLVEVQAHAAEKILKETESLIQWQRNLWQESLESLRQRWTEALATQSQEFNESLKQGMTITLADHSQQLTDVRAEFLQAFHAVSKQFTNGQSESLKAQRSLQDEFGCRLEDFWQNVKDDVDASRSERDALANGLIQSVFEKVTAWQSQLQQSSEASNAQLQELRKQGEILLKVVAQEEQLAGLQSQLAENLETLRAAQTFEETLHSLSAAVHLLTARVKPRAA